MDGRVPPFGRRLHSGGEVATELAEWVFGQKPPDEISEFGLKLKGGGVHQTKTMMFEELEHLLATGTTSAADLARAAVEDNVLAKRTLNTRRLTWRHLMSLYGLGTQPAIAKTLLGLWHLDTEGRRLNALLVALSRDPLLRDTAEVVVTAPIGAQVHRSQLETAIFTQHPGRLSEKMVRSLAQNCNATWTQSGHLKGRVKKFRQRVTPTPANTAFAALLATVCGFGGPSILSSTWMRLLDLSHEQALDHLRRAEAAGLARVRSAGDVIEIAVRKPMAVALGVRELEDV